MRVKPMSLSAIALALMAFSFAGAVGAVPLLCDDANVNHMYVESSRVSQCLGGGVGNINGNPATDAFLNGAGAGSGLVGIGAGGFSQFGSIGMFSLEQSLWQAWGEIAIGFKFGTGNQPDNWFVYLLNADVSSGFWQFNNVFDRGGGLSHVQLYGRSSPTVPDPGSTTSVPEPGTLALLGVGLLGAGLARRRKQA